ncbi:MAG: hypothetical protein ACOH5I_07875 [Oligoflexus sp.]
MSQNKNINRRDLIKLGGASMALGSSLGISRLAIGQDAPKKFLFIISASGGASIIDSFLAQPTGPAAFNNLVQPNGSAFSCVPPLQNSIQGAINLGNGYSQATFLTKHTADTVVMTSEVSSVNHIIAAKRAVTGDNANGGRTLAEAVAMDFGKTCTLANLNLSGGGYGLHGDDDTIPSAARAEPITDPLMFAFATHGHQGVNNILSAQEIRAARALRTQLEAVSKFHKDFAGTPLLDVYRRNRDEVVSNLEKGNMMSKLMLLDPQSNNLSELGLQISPDMAMVLEKFPNLANDPFEAKVALSFLAAKNGMSNAFTIAPNMSPLVDATGTPNSPIAFDWSHVDHRGAQNAMWSYILKSTDALIELLKATDIDGDPAKGKMWSQSMVYIATEFGRDKTASGGSGHHLNNGNIMISPMLNGNRVFGGVDAATGLTYGFDPVSGQPAPNTKMHEKDIYAAVAHAMGINYQGRRDFPAMVRKA